MKDVTDMQFRDEYMFLSNMYNKPVHMDIEGDHYTFKCAEAAFQAHKCISRAHEFEAMTGKEAKAAGKRVPLRRDWEYVKDDVMRSVINAKFQDPELRDRLKNIQGDICEDNTWGDKYWGRCYGVGQNKLGQILMETRDNMTANKNVSKNVLPAKTINIPDNTGPSNESDIYIF